MDYSPPGLCVHGILHSRILECHALLQRIFLTQGSPTCRQIPYHLSHQGRSKLKHIYKDNSRDFPGGPAVKIVPLQRATGSVLGQETKILHAIQCDQKVKNKQHNSTTLDFFLTSVNLIRKVHMVTFVSILSIKKRVWSRSLAIKHFNPFKQHVFTSSHLM